MAFNFNTPPPKRKRSTGFISDDESNQTPLFADIKTPPVRDKTRNKSKHRSKIKHSEIRTEEKYMSETSIIRDPQGGSMQTLKKTQSDLKSKNNHDDHFRKPDLIAKAGKTNDRILAAAAKDKRNDHNRSRKISHTKYREANDSNNSDINGNDIQSPIHAKLSNPIQSPAQSNRYGVLDHPSKSKITASNPKKTKFFLTKQNSAKHRMGKKTGSKIVPGVSLNSKQKTLYHEFDKAKSSRVDFTGRRYNETRQKKLVKSSLEQLCNTNSNNRNNHTKGSNEKPIDLCCDSSDDESQIQNENELKNLTQIVSDATNANENNIIDEKQQINDDKNGCACVRISIATQVYSLGCFAKFNFDSPDPHVIISYKCSYEPKLKSKAKKKEYKVTTKRIEFSSEVLLRYYSDEEDDNGQSDTSNDKKRKEMEDASPLDDIGNILVLMSREVGNSSEERVVLEMRFDDDFQEILALSRKSKCTDQTCKLSPDEVKEYTLPLVKDSKKEKKRRLTMPNKQNRERSGSPKDNGEFPKDQSKSDKKNNGNISILVYPFDEEQSVISDAAKTLREASGMSCRFENDKIVWYHENCAKLPKNNSIERIGEEIQLSRQVTSRTHYLTIRHEDLSRLDDGEFLNDTLIDFWMRWISRNDDCISTNVHFFTSHFFTALADGPETVSSWTAKKNINIFEKKFIFIPINEQLHWSLCVVVNCNKISEIGDKKFDNDEIPFLLFFDSLKAHRKQKIAAYVRNWIKFEADRLHISLNGQNISKDSLPIVAPHIPYQDNSWDCGVFVCRFAYSLYLLRDTKFLSGELSGKRPFEKSITNSPEFKFGMDDIAQLRREIKALVLNLSEIYLEKKERDHELKKKKKSQKLTMKTDN